MCECSQCICCTVMCSEQYSRSYGAHTPKLYFRCCFISPWDLENWTLDWGWKAPEVIPTTIIDNTSIRKTWWHLKSREITITPYLIFFLNKNKTKNVMPWFCLNSHCSSSPFLVVKGLISWWTFPVIAKESWTHTHTWRTHTSKRTHLDTHIWQN